MSDLLNLVAYENARALRLEVGMSPVVELAGQSIPIEGPPVTTENARLLFEAVATEEQRQELETCGDVKFVFRFGDAGNFIIRATLKRGDIQINVQNIGRPPRSDRLHT